jgi:hypothetical protein
MLLVRAADDRLLPAANALGRGVALLAFGALAVELHQHGIVHVSTERAFDRLQVGLVDSLAAATSLRPICQHGTSETLNF